MIGSYRGCPAAVLAFTAFLIGCTGVASLSCGSSPCVRRVTSDITGPGHGVGSLSPVAFVSGRNSFAPPPSAIGGGRSLYGDRVSPSVYEKTRARPDERVSPRIRAAVQAMRRLAARGMAPSLGGRTEGLTHQAPAAFFSQTRKRHRGTGTTTAGALNANEYLEDDEDDDEDDDDVDEDDDEEENDMDDGNMDDEYDPLAPKGPLENNNYGEVWVPVQARPRRNRKSNAVRRLIQENVVKPSSLIYPLFVHDEDESEPIKSLPGQRCLSPSDVIKEIGEAKQFGVNTFMLFPRIDESLKSPMGEESTNPDGIMPRMIMAIKDAHPDVSVLADVALDPYSSLGQDGIVDEETGYVMNDMTVYQICKQAVNLARAGADMVCPSEMMDGRVSAIREALDMEACVDTSILSYTCKYASSLYGPFRDALNSHIRGGGDKKTYQMDPSNAREAEREAELDVQEGADMLMVKPGLPYLDVLQRVRQKTNVPVAAYHVSGEYAMIKAAAEKGWIDEKQVVLESLKSLRRAGADAIATYYAKDAARWMVEDCTGERAFSEPCY